MSDRFDMSIRRFRKRLERRIITDQLTVIQNHEPVAQHLRRLDIMRDEDVGETKRRL